ncbi:MAG: RNA polymerase sigma factor [Lentisphaerae bacterium]|nr:RNA polymerase sigma factor [Lentisphaerota bacterium]
MTFFTATVYNIVTIKYADMSDGALAERALNGDKKGFEELVRRYQRAVFGLAYHMTSNVADAEDLTQEAFVTAYRRLDSFDMDRSFRNWIITICANLTKNTFRSRIRRKKTEESYLLQREIQESGKKKENHGDLLTALAALSPKLRAPLVLKHVEGCAYEEIARILNIGISAAKMRVKRGRDELVKLMESQHTTNEI